MTKRTRLERATMLLRQSANIVSQIHPKNKYLEETHKNIRKAIHSLQKATQIHNKKKAESEKQYQEWWGNSIATSRTSQIPQLPMSPEAWQRSLEEINKMIQHEQKKLEELEKQANKQTEQEQILND